MHPGHLYAIRECSMGNLGRGIPGRFIGHRLRPLVCHQPIEYDYPRLRLVYLLLFDLSNDVHTRNVQQHRKDLATESYGLVFGFNMFLALALQTILTVIVADERGLNLAIRPQFVVYGCYYGGIALVFAVMGAITVFFHCRRSRSVVVYLDIPN